MIVTYFDLRQEMTAPMKNISVFTSILSPACIIRFNGKTPFFVCL